MWCYLEVRMGRPVSLVWAFFEKINKDEAKCNFCKKKLKTAQGTTKALTTHIGTQTSVHLSLSLWPLWANPAPWFCCASIAEPGSGIRQQHCLTHCLRASSIENVNAFLDLIFTLTTDQSSLLNLNIKKKVFSVPSWRALCLYNHFYPKTHHLV